ncbi:MAG: hypothetical protein AAF767_04155 [Pseudomonadota bacterium]
MIGLTALAAAQTGSAYADIRDADLWIGFDDTENGFLIDEDTGRVWMTGACAKTLEPASKSGTVWTSRTIESVSVGRGSTTLDQQFDLDTNDAAPRIIVTSAGRGGVQTFPAALDRACDGSGTCANLIATQTACER